MSELCECGEPATQKLLVKTVLLEDRGTLHDAGDVWNSKAPKHLCDECSSKMFADEPDKLPEPTREALLGLPEKPKAIKLDPSNVPPNRKSCKTCAHREGQKCVRTGYHCSTEVSHGGQCAQGGDLKLWTPIVSSRGGYLA